MMVNELYGFFLNDYFDLRRKFPWYSDGVRAYTFNNFLKHLVKKVEQMTHHQKFSQGDLLLK